MKIKECPLHTLFAFIPDIAFQRIKLNLHLLELSLSECGAPPTHDEYHNNDKHQNTATSNDTNESG